MFRLKQLSIVLMASLLMASAAPAQVGGGSITGIVTDQTGAAIPGVAITITDNGTGVPNRVTSNESGVYTVPLLKPAHYRLSAEKTGFKKYERSSILVQVGGTTRFDFSLSLGEMNQSIVVAGETLSLERETSDTQTTITGMEIENLPLTSIFLPRTAADFMQLAPGVTGHGSSTGRTLATAISGSMVSSTTLSVDGADIATLGSLEGDLAAFQIPPDAIGEFRLEANNANAENGRSGGGSASFEVKSGTNQAHGSAYEFVRNDALNANDFFQNASPATCTRNGQLKACRNPYKQNEFGVTVGGPIKKNKAFIFGWYDGYRLTQGGGGGFADVPTDQMKQGDFTNYGTYDGSGNWTLIPIVDPVTKTLCGALVCNNIVNPLNFDRVSKLLLPMFPQALGGPREVTSNYTSTVANPEAVNQWGMKFDLAPNETNRISGMFDEGKQTSPNIPLIPAPLGGGDQPSINLTRNVRINWNLTPRSNFTHQLTLAWNFWANGQTAPATWAGKSDWVDYLGLQGFTPNYKTQFPRIQIGDSGYGNGGAPSIASQHSSIVKDALTWTRGRHTIKIGFEYLKGALNSVDVGYSAGYFDFMTQETAAPTVPGSGIGFASFLLGYADQAQAFHYNAPSYARDSYWAAFVQDDFKVTRKLTLNLGLRYDLFDPDQHKYYQKSWIDYSVPNPDASNILGAFVTARPDNPSGLNMYKTNFSPRVGLAYSLNDKTVVRAAFGIFYAMGNANRLDYGALVQGFNGAWGRTSPNNGATPAFIWGTDIAQPFVPSFAPGAFLGQGQSGGVGFGSLISQDRTDSLAPYAENYTLGVQHQLPAQMALTVSFIGNTGVHLASRVMPADKLPPQYMQMGMTHICGDVVCPGQDQGFSLLYEPIGFSLAQQVPAVAKMPIDPSTGNHSPFAGFEALYGAESGTLGQALRTAPQYQGTHRYYEGVGTSVYDALQVKLEKHFSDNLSLLVSYAWSKTLTNGGSIFSTFSSEFGTTTPWNAHAQKAYSYADIPQNLSIAYIYDLPVGKGKRFLSRGKVANAILGGWKTSGILQYQSGRPQNIEVVGHTSNLEDQGWGSPDRLTGVPMASEAYHSGHFQPATPLQPGDSQFNGAAFAMPCEWCFGTLTPAEATVRDFYWPNEDMSLMRVWRLHESWNLTFHADFFNVFNRHVFGQNNGAYADEPVYGQPGFGTVAAQVDPPRFLQFGLNLKW